MTTLKKIKRGGKDKYLGMLTDDELAPDAETPEGTTPPGEQVQVDNSILSSIRKIIPDISQNKKYLAVGALALGLGGIGYKRYQNMKISQKQKKEIEDLRNKEIKIFEEKLKKMELDKEQKKKMIRYFLLYSIGAILIGSTIRHLKKGGSSFFLEKVFF